MPNYWRVHDVAYDAIAYGKITTVAGEVIEDRGITFDGNAMDDTNAGTVDITLPANTEELRIRSDADAGDLTLFVNGDETDGVGIPISGTSLIDVIRCEVETAATLQFAAGLGAKYFEITALGMSA